MDVKYQMEYFLLTTKMHTAAKTTKSLYGRLNDLGVSVKQLGVQNWIKGSRKLPLCHVMKHSPQRQC